jgi:F-type H+-transporting ATPase subunit gamma
MSSYKKLKGVFLFYNRLLKTTKAIKLVTLSKIQMIQNSLKKRKYSVLHAKKLFELSFRQWNPDTIPLKNILIPITTERSCCGPIDQILQSYTFKLITSFRQNHAISFFFLGKRGYSLFKKDYKKNFLQAIYNIKKQPISLISSSVVVDSVLSYSTDYYYILFNKFYSIFEQVPSIYKFYSYEFFIRHFDRFNLNLFFQMIKSKKDSTFLSDLYLFNVNLIMYNALKENSVAELGGRMAAMDNAIKNISEIIIRVQILYQKARQNAITNELIEIISCLNVLISAGKENLFISLKNVLSRYY